MWKLNAAIFPPHTKGYATKHIAKTDVLVVVASEGKVLLRMLQMVGKYSLNTTPTPSHFHSLSSLFSFNFPS